MFAAEEAEEVAKGLTISVDFFDEFFKASLTPEEKGLGITARALVASVLIEKGLAVVKEGVVEEDAPKGLGGTAGAIADEVSDFGAALDAKGFVNVTASGAFVLANEDSEVTFAVLLLIASIGIDGNENGAVDAAGVDELLIEPNTEEVAYEGFASGADIGRDDDVALENGFEDDKLDDATFATSEVGAPSDPDESVVTVPNSGNFGNPDVDFFSDSLL